MEQLEIIQYSRGPEHGIGTCRVSRQAGQVKYHVRTERGWEPLPFDQNAQILCEEALMMLSPGARLSVFSNDRKTRLHLAAGVAGETQQAWFIQNDVGEWLHVQIDDVPIETRCDLLAACCPVLSPNRATA